MYYRDKNITIIDTVVKSLSHTTTILEVELIIQHEHHFCLLESHLQEMIMFQQENMQIYHLSMKGSLATIEAMKQNTTIVDDVTLQGQ